jgi:hypothetical protein
MQVSPKEYLVIALAHVGLKLYSVRNIRRLRKSKYQIILGAISFRNFWNSRTLEVPCKPMWRQQYQTSRRKILQKKCHMQSLRSGRISEWILKACECEGKDIAVTRTGFKMLSLKNVAKNLGLS